MIAADAGGKRIASKMSRTSEPLVGMLARVTGRCVSEKEL